MQSTWFLINLGLFCSIYVVSSCVEEKRAIFKYGNIHIAGLILARGGSKGIKLKNLAKIGNKTLIEIALAPLHQVKRFDSIWVSTDNAQIYQEVFKVNKKTNIYWRSKESATDEATSIYAVQEFLAHRPEVDAVVLVQCTSPFVNLHYVQKGIDQFLKSRFECVFSVSRSYQFRWSQNSKGDLIPLNFNPAKRPRRQDWKGELVENGMFYIATRRLLKKGLFQNQK